MHKLKSLALLALAGLGLSASGGVTTNAWWDVPFTSPTAETNVVGYGGVALTIGEIGALTNNFRGASAQQPYLAGLWTMVDGDESYVTNEFNPTNTWKAFGGDNCLKLDTQGNDLTWTVDQDNVMANGLKALVDADLYLVGSDSEPTDFDENNDVQTAVYLKNEIEEDTGETTNSVLCVYVFNSTLNGGIGANEWQELDGVELDDNAWAHVQVLVDHSDDEKQPPTVQVFVNGTQMHARNGDATSWTAANGSKSQGAGRVSSVAFRGTGAVDNFVGKTLLETFSQAYFKAEVYLDGQITNELCQVTPEKLNIGGTTRAEFTQFMWEEYNADLECAVYGLDRVEIVDFVQNKTITYPFDYNPDNGTIDPMPEEGDVAFYGAGFFSVSAFTAGAPGPATATDIVTNVIARIYFKTAYAYDGLATMTMDGTTTTNAVTVTPADFAEEGATKTIEWTFPAEKNGNVLSTIQLYNGATLEYANKTATVTVTTNAALQADTLFAAATYVPGTLADGQDLKDDGGVDGLYTFTAYVPPVAIRVSADGTTTNECSSLRQAIEDYAQNGDTVYLVADDRVSFTTEALEIEIDKALTIDGGSNTLFGVSDYSAGGYHDIFVIGNGALTIKDLKFSEFGDTATSFQYETYPIVTSGSYTGQLTLDGVTIDKFARTAVNLNGGTVLITNCTFTADPTAYFQTGVETLNAVVTVVDTTITGVNSTITGEDPEGAAVFTLKGHDGYTGTGSITVLSGEYSGQFIVAAEALATGSVILSNGTFIATADAAESAFNLDAGNVEISGGWFDREPEAKYIAQGLAAYEDAPGEEAPWTVRAAKVTIDFYVDGAVYATTSVVVGATGYAPADPEKAADAQYAYTFTGWTNVVGESYSAATLPAATTATNYYAAFSETVNRYDVTFTVDGTTVATTNAPYGDTLYGPADPVKTAETGYTVAFAGWTNAVAGGATVAAADLPAVTGEATWAAVFTTTAIEYTVTVALDGGTLASGDSIPETYTVETAAFPLPTPTKEGFTFQGWVDGDDQPVTQIAGGATGDISLTATWEEVSGVVEVNPGDGLAKYKTEHPDATVPAPIEFTSDATPLCKIAFVAPAAGKYVLMTSTTVNGTYQAEGTPTAYEAGALVELTETSSATTKFFKIGYEK